MQTLPTKLPGLALLQPQVHGDERGFFAETYRREWHASAGIPEHERFIQDNHSRSARGVVRGLHFHTGAGAAKLVRCARGAIFDVAVDLRRGSPTYACWEGFRLDDEQLRVLYIPVGLAHGFCVLSEQADVVYKQTSYHAAGIEGTLAWDDPELAIEWPLRPGQATLSERDVHAPTLREIAAELPFEYAGDSGGYSGDHTSHSSATTSR